MAFGAPSLKGRALRYLAQREHSRAELERKLARYAEEDEESEEDSTAAARIAGVLDELEAQGFISAARVAESVLAGAGQRFGSRRLKQTLQAKGLDADLVAATLAQARHSELARATEVWRRKFGAAAQDAKESARQMRFLAARGFDGDVIRRVVKGNADEA